MTTDEVYFERGVSRRHGYMTEFYVDDPEYIVTVPDGLRDIAALAEPLSVSEKGIIQAFEIPAPPEGMAAHTSRGARRGHDRLDGRLDPPVERD
jgi:threonine dehydrogenase-like Zn-dependent dehydrogenase